MLDQKIVTVLAHLYGTDIRATVLSFVETTPGAQLLIVTNDRRLRKQPIASVAQNVHVYTKQTAKSVGALWDVGLRQAVTQDSTVTALGLGGVRFTNGWYRGLWRAIAIDEWDIAAPVTDASVVYRRQNVTHWYPEFQPVDNDYYTDFVAAELWRRYGTTALPLPVVGMFMVAKASTWRAACNPQGGWRAAATSPAGVLLPVAKLARDYRVAVSPSSFVRFSGDVVNTLTRGRTGEQL